MEDIKLKVHTISSLVARLKRYQLEYGDIPVYVDTEDYCEPITIIKIGTDSHIPSKIVKLY